MGRVSEHYHYHHRLEHEDKLINRLLSELHGTQLLGCSFHVFFSVTVAELVDIFEHLIGLLLNLFGAGLDTHEQETDDTVSDWCQG